MSCKSAIYVANTTDQILAVGDVVAPSQLVRRMGNAIDLSGSSVILKAVGFYLVTATITTDATAAGTVDFTLQINGLPVQGAIVAESVAVGDIDTVTLTAIVKNACGCDFKTISVVLGTTAITVTNYALVVEKL